VARTLPSLAVSIISGGVNLPASLECARVGVEIRTRTAPLLRTPSSERRGIRSVALRRWPLAEGSGPDEDLARAERAGKLTAEGDLHMRALRAVPSEICPSQHGERAFDIPVGLERLRVYD